MPETLLGRLISLVVCFFGFFLKSLFTAALFIFVIIVDEGEQKSYSQIKLLYSKGEKKSLANVYYSNYITYKFRKIAKGRLGVMKNIRHRNSFQSFREKYLIRIISSMAIPLSITDFCSKTRVMWNNYAKDTLEGCQDLNQVFLDFNDFCCETTLDFHNKTTTLMKNGFQMVNLAYMILFCGGLFPIGDYELIKGFKTVSVKEYNLKCREFEVKYYKKIKENPFENKKGGFNINGEVNLISSHLENEHEINNCAYSDYSDSLGSLSNIDVDSRYNSN